MGAGGGGGGGGGCLVTRLQVRGEGWRYKACIVD